jgi:hypothetical protein
MLMDGHTYKDLEIFEGEGGKTSVFDLCNLTRTDGGAKALRQRMKKPWSRPEKIVALQESLSFILAHRMPFDRLPSNATTRVLEKYLHGSLPLMSGNGLLEFWTGALELRFGGDFRPYMRIVRGVNATAALIRTLRRISAAAELQHATRDVARILDEVRTLVARPTFGAISSHARGCATGPAGPPPGAANGRTAVGARVRAGRAGRDGGLRHAQRLRDAGDRRGSARDRGRRTLAPVHR